MSTLWSNIRQAVEAGRYVTSDHALDRLRKRGLVEWHIEAGTPAATLRRERPAAMPNPAVEVAQRSPTERLSK